MFGRLISLFVLITVVYQVITLIINQANAKKERERARELAKRQSGEAKAAGQGARTESSTAEPRESATPAPGRQSRLDELAARRQRQLEELRRRRAGASPGRGTSVRAGTESPGQGRSTAPRSTVRGSIPSAHESLQQGPGNVAAKIERDAAALRERKKREYDRQVRAQQAMQREQEEVIAAQRASDKKLAMAASAEAQRDLDAETARQLAAPDATRSSVTRVMRDRRALRQAVILNELLQPPLSLRNPID